MLRRPAPLPQAGGGSSPASSSSSSSSMLESLDSLPSTSMSVESLETLPPFSPLAPSSKSKPPGSAGGRSRARRSFLKPPSGRRSAGAKKKQQQPPTTPKEEEATSPVPSSDGAKENHATAAGNNNEDGDYHGDGSSSQLSSIVRRRMNSPRAPSAERMSPSAPKRLFRTEEGGGASPPREQQEGGETGEGSVVASSSTPSFRPMPAVSRSGPTQPLSPLTPFTVMKEKQNRKGDAVVSPENSTPRTTNNMANIVIPLTESEHSEFPSSDDTLPLPLADRSTQTEPPKPNEDEDEDDDDEDNLAAAADRSADSKNDVELRTALDSLAQDLKELRRLGSGDASNFEEDADDDDDGAHGREEEGSNDRSSEVGYAEFLSLIGTDGSPVKVGTTAHVEAASCGSSVEIEAEFGLDAAAAQVAFEGREGSRSTTDGVAREGNDEFEGGSPDAAHAVREATTTPGRPVGPRAEEGEGSSGIGAREEDRAAARIDFEGAAVPAYKASEETTTEKTLSATAENIRRSEARVEQSNSHEDEAAAEGYESDDGGRCLWLPGPLLALRRPRSAVVAPPKSTRDASVDGTDELRRSAETLRAHLRVVEERANDLAARTASTHKAESILSEVRAIEGSLDRISSLCTDSVRD